MKIAIIDYNAGNVQSVLFALERIGVSAILTSDPKEIKSANKVIFPGVGEAKNTMAHLHKTGLADVICNLKQPTLGICLGMQLLCQHSEEGNTDCLNIIPLKVKKFVVTETKQKIPHIGWNKFFFDSNTKLLEQNKSGDYAYFVHSYYVEKGKYTTATCDYILPFSATLQKDNFYATQFHPEKSGEVGELILKKFINL
jgi:glutamine amidotransferase